MGKYRLSSVTALAVCCLLFASVSTAQTSEEGKKSDLFGIGFEFKWAFPGYQGKSLKEISGLSDEVRTVPIHKNDYRGGTPVLFPDQKIKIISSDPPCNGFCMTDYEFLPVAKIWRFKPKVGLVATFRIESEPAVPVTAELSKDFPEITYQGSQRGVGAALVYMAPRSTVARYVARTSLAMVKELEVEITKSNAFLIGSKYRHYDINIESGWDRYGKLEVYKTYNLGRVDVNQIYLGWSYLPSPDDGDIGVHIIGGRSVKKFRPGAITGTLGEIGNPWFFQVAISLRAKTW
ncbi:MAG: hypothetical protein ABL899_02725 [Nitrospira sp.]